MARLVLIDDDPVEALVIGGLLEHADEKHAFESFTSVEAFVAANGAGADLVLLDRRIPPNQSFESSLSALAASSHQGPVVLITAGPCEETGLSWRGGLHGPIDKGRLLTPQALSGLVTEALSKATARNPSEPGRSAPQSS
jgi:CheY-like chemotaxis protein